MQAQSTDPLLHPLFQDNAVLQRERAVPVWGIAAGGAAVKISLRDAEGRVQTVGSTASQDGSWSANLPATPAGGPYTLTIRSGRTTAAAHNILFGDVWLCSGQSNMEMQVRSGLNAEAEAMTSADPLMRLLTVGKHASANPQKNFREPVEWKKADPQSVAHFSAACYFMGRDLRRSERVPIGLISASWGGTALDTWRSEDSLAKDPRLADRLALLRQYRDDPSGAGAIFSADWSRWWQEKFGTAPEPWRANAGGDWKTVPSFDYWENWGIDSLNPFNGLVFFRTEVLLTAEQAKNADRLLLGPIDDFDMTWANEVGVGSDTAWGVARNYALQPGTLRAGLNTIVVGVYDAWGNGGFLGTAEQRAIKLKDGTSVPLPSAANWQFLQSSPQSAGEPPRAPWDGITGLAGIYNGMIAPLGQFGFRGAAWYQGESDTGRASDYAERLAAMISGWRTQFHNEKMGLLIVQLAGYGSRSAEPVESGTASIRDQQRRAADADPNAGLVVTVDIGDVVDIHPANKQDIGLRLARAARVLTYGATHSIAGAKPLTAKRTGNGIVVSFGSVEGKLISHSGAPVSFELCGTTQSSCRFVGAKLTTTTVEIESDGKEATRVRYCWGGSPICNLSDGTALPVTPFELRVE